MEGIDNVIRVQYSDSMKHTEKLEKVCIYCGSAFYIYACQSKNGRGKFCSKECADNNRKHGDKLSCSYCGKVFYRRNGEQKDTSMPFCSRQCYSTYRFMNIKETTYIKRFGRHEHIIVAENYLGRRLKKGEIIHHIDKNKHNNKIENLAVIPNQSIHASIHFGDVSVENYRITAIKGE